MHLVIDVGNTLIKAGMFEQHKLVDIFMSKDPQEVQQWYATYPYKRSIISNVRKEKEFEALLEDALVFDHKTPVPLSTTYKTPETLGLDRLAATIGADDQCKRKPLLVIDAGTCITYDCVNPEGVHLGGGISPGLEMRFKALNHYTGRLPLVEMPAEVQLIGDNTLSGISSGVIYGAVAEIEGIIRQYQEKFDKITIFLTGGDCKIFERKIKASIFADPYLVLKGLNRILEHNA